MAESCIFRGDLGGETGSHSTISNYGLHVVGCVREGAGPKNMDYVREHVGSGGRQEPSTEWASRETIEASRGLPSAGASG